MATELSKMIRKTISLITIVLMPFAVQGADGPATTDPLIIVEQNLIYAMIALAVVQVIFILSMSGIMRTMSGPGSWVGRLGRKGGKVGVLIPIMMLLTSEVSAQAYVGGDDGPDTYQTFWLLLVVNVFLFVVMLAQINVLRGMTRVITGVEEGPSTGAEQGPSWTERLMKRMTRQVEIEKEEDILLHHEYDGIRELDNVLPPWWLWLFYGSIVWSVVYIVNVHVIEIWPQQDKEYIEEMAQAELDVAAYMATVRGAVDETNVEYSEDPAVLANGGTLFVQYCSPCHGADGAGSENSVGPNLTDAFWIHGGGAKNVFKTIKYGVPEKGMISWKSQLKPTEIAAITSYILSQAGKGGATQKEAQGEPWTESPTKTTDSTATRSDTTRVAAAR